MFDGVSLMNQLQSKIKEMDSSVSALAKTGTHAAEANRIYNVELAKTILSLKADGVAVGIIEKLAKGEENIARLGFEKEKAEVMYQANQSHYNAIKLEIRVLEGIINREWTRGEQT